MKRRFQDDVLRTNKFQEFTAVEIQGFAYQFFVQGDGHGRAFAQARHFFPLAGGDGLFNGMNVQFGQLFQTFQGPGGRKGAVGIGADFNVGSEFLAHPFDQFQFGLPIQSADFDFNHAKAGPDFFQYLVAHKIRRPHPNQAVDGYGVLAARKGRRKQNRRMRAVQREQGLFQPENDGRHMPELGQ